MTRDRIDKEMKRIGYASDIRNKHEFQSIWSGCDIKFNTKHNLPHSTIIYSKHWGKPVEVEIAGNTWLDVYKAADECIIKSGDMHHIFIEDFRPTKDGKMELLTGS